MNEARSPAEIQPAGDTSDSLSLLEHGPTPTGGADPYHAYLDSLDSAESRATMKGCLDRIARLVLEAEQGPLPHDHPPITGEGRSWWVLRYEHVLHIRSVVQAQNWSPAHVNKHLVAVRRVLKECWRLGLMSAEDYHRACDVPGLKSSREPAGRSLHPEELDALLRSCEELGGPAAVRDAALVGVLYCTGTRRDEAAKALIENYDRAERALKFIGKGDKEYTAYIHPAVVPLLDAWLALLGTRKGPLFRPIDRWGNIGDRPLTKRAVGLIVARARTRSGLPPLSTHDFRRTLIGDLLDAGTDLATVQQLVNHASPVTTARYDRRPERTRRAAVDGLHFPSATDEGP